jgi:16S rRNA G966 N2-methylase RsmD
VDRGPDAIAAIVTNLAKSRLGESARVIRGDVNRFLDAVRQPYDLILCDPPYGWVAMGDLLLQLARPEVTSDGAVVVVETGRRDPPLVLPGRLTVIRVRKHGDTVVTIMRAGFPHFPIG